MFSNAWPNVRRDSFGSMYVPARLLCSRFVFQSTASRFVLNVFSTSLPSAHARAVHVTLPVLLLTLRRGFTGPTSVPLSLAERTDVTRGLPVADYPASPLTRRFS